MLTQAYQHELHETKLSMAIGKLRALLKSLENSRSILVLAISCLFAQFSIAQPSTSPRFKEIIPFQYVAGFIVVDVLIDGKLPLKFIFDTGSRYTILTDNSFLNIIGREPEESIQLVGADRSRVIEAQMLRRTLIDVGDISIRSQSLIVLREDFLDLASLIGEPVYGILGMEAFGAYAVTINYQAGYIKLENSNRIKIAKSATAIPINVSTSKAYLPVFTKVHNKYQDTLNLLIDSGASLSLLLLMASSNTSVLPEKIIASPIAEGLGGDLLGYIGRSDSVQFGPFDLQDVITQFQIIDLDTSVKTSHYREGIIGNGILDRFLVTIDYPKSMLYLKPRRKFNKQRRYDRSGLRLLEDGAAAGGLVVQMVNVNSPADRAGLRPGDRIIRVGILPAHLRGLEGVRRQFRQRIGKSIKLVYLRGSVRIETDLVLARII